MTPAEPAAGPPPGPSLTSAVVIGSGIFSTALLLLYSGPLSWTQQLLAFAIANVAMLPLAWYLRPARDKTDFPIFQILLTYYAVSFGWTAFSSQIVWYSAGEAAISRAYFVACIGIAALFTGYYLLRPRALIPFPLPVFQAKLPSSFIYVLGLGLVAVNIGLFALPGDSKGGAVEQVRTAFGSCGMALLWLYYFRPTTDRSERMLVIGLTAALMLIYSLMASIKPLVVPIIVIAVTWWRTHHRIPWMMMGVVVALFITVNPIKHYWRDRVWHAGHAVSITENLGYLADAFDDYYFGPNIRGIEGDKASINRLCDIPVLTRAVSYTPRSLPYWRGITLKVLLYSMVPRAIWPDKPRAQFSNQFGRIYEIISPTDTLTLISINWITEIYINFGPMGVLLGMTLIGMATRVVEQSVSRPQVPDLVFAIGVGAAGPLYNGGENLAMVWGGFPLKLVLLMATAQLTWWVLYRRGSQAAPDLPAPTQTHAG